MIGANQAGTTHVNEAAVTYGNYAASTGQVTTTVVEPDLTFNKTMTTTPSDAADDIVFELVATNSSAVNISSAMDVHITDTLDSYLSLNSVSVDALGASSFSFLGSAVDVVIDQTQPWRNHHRDHQCHSEQ